eukprot:10262098-Karenia_brevis.AAC.1
MLLLMLMLMLRQLILALVLVPIYLSVPHDAGDACAGAAGAANAVAWKSVTMLNPEVDEIAYIIYNLSG